jgi:hypothetical protein
MFTVFNSIVDERIAYIKFKCDLNSCKGACCTLPGGRGAPLDDNEVAEIQKAIPVIKKYLPDRQLEEIRLNDGIEGYVGSFATSCIDNKDCVFVFYENDTAKCAFEKAFFNNEISWRKPISCHLFPIRVSDFGGDVLRYEKIKECKPAIVKGKADSTPLFEFLQDALIRKYGKQWYDEFKIACVGNVNRESEFQI